MIFLTFLTALALSGVAAYYSVIGLAAIFPGSFWPIIIMGSVLEGAKLVTVSWLYRNWKMAHIGMKSYLTVATVILMLITSMGIFGYLSKAHLEHSSDTAPLVSKVSLLEEKINIQKGIINESRKELKQFDEIIEQTVGRTTDEKGLDKAQAFRRSQQKDRSRLVLQIEQAQKSIALHQEELAPLSVELKKAEADLGPIKYVAALAYGEATTDIIDKAVRLVILLIIVVFDPLAVLLLIAANMSMTQPKQKAVTQSTTEGAHTENNFGFMAQEIAKVIPEAVVSDESEMVTIDQARINELMIKSFNEMHEKIENPVDKHAYLKQPFKHFENLQPMPYKREEPHEEEIREIKIENIQEDHFEIPKNNLIVIDDITGETIPPITKYDYSDPYTFREKDNK